MKTDTQVSTGTRVLATIAAFVVVVAGMRAAEPLLVPFLLAAFIAIISAPSLFWLQRRGLSSGVAVMLVILVIIGAGTVLIAMVGSSVDDFSTNLPAYKARLEEQTVSLMTWIEGLGIKVPKDALLRTFDPGQAMGLAASLLNGLGGALGNAFLMLFTVVFMLLEAAGFPTKLRAAFGGPQASFPNLDQFTRSVKHYMALKTGMSLATGAAVTLWLAVLGVDYPVLWGLLAFLLNFVPTIGSIIAAVPPMLLAVVQLGPGSALLVGLGYLAVNFVIGSVVEPRLMGRGLGLSTLVVFLSLVFWGWVLGPVGMLLSVPLTMTVKIALNSSEDTRWIAILLDSEDVGDIQEEVKDPQPPAAEAG